MNKQIIGMVMALYAVAVIGAITSPLQTNAQARVQVVERSYSQLQDVVASLTTTFEAATQVAAVALSMHNPIMTPLYNVTEQEVSVRSTDSQRPSCSYETRGMFWYIQGKENSSDQVEICIKKFDDSYKWVSVHFDS